ncbi:PA14 domain-containing protein [Hymenobacter cavernae]|uniref:PKD domain-containing protein n=1 Tax=Hymenobacter cavernae TaxID=2044852 RepID=A0ABQ1TLH5_9BACT|nr:PA14 domain-containing protein [Hymenobacter cavernae]GGE96521.1 hypothetical protein GCM10011383_04130 [Hymenobacter cavernae]
MKHKLLLILIFLALTGGQLLLAQAPPSGFSSVTISEGWNEAVGLAFNQSGSHMFVWERPGKVWVAGNGQRQLLLDISEEVGAWRDFGLLGFALHPQFETNGYFYVLYTVDRHHLLNYGTSSYNPQYDEYYNATINRVTRYTAIRNESSYTVNPASRKVLLGATKETGIPVLHMSHGPGSLVFGTDGSLFVSCGDGASYESADVGSASESYFTQALADGIIPPEQNVGALRAQQLESYNGKVLRIDPETGNGIVNNPFYRPSFPGAAQSKVWALGLRNPFRIALKPGSGSATDPGVLYIGDVGFDTWEEVNIAVRPGMNFGWPLFEGLTKQELYWPKKTGNPYTPTGIAGCAQSYFYFQDLIQQETPTGSATFSNPCATNQAVPAGITTFVHSRPSIDWRHLPMGPARTGTFTGGIASEINIGAPGSPVAGAQFGGSSGMVGGFYTHSSFPAEYRNTCFFGDYASGWIRSLSTDASNKPVAVRNFINDGAVVVAMATHPTDGGLYYVNFWPSEIRKVVYNAPVNTAPVAIATADKTYGNGPLTVQFTGNSSRDPDGETLMYLWNFGDGTTSSLANPAHTFPGGSPTNYTVTLMVKDNASSAQTSLVISANNTPPRVTITSLSDGAKYPLTSTTNYPLRAAVADQEQSSGQLSYQWQTSLHHDDHVHPDPVITSPEATTTISPLGCGTEVYYYQVRLTVTDDLGLATTQDVKLYPDCSSTNLRTPENPVNTVAGLDYKYYEGFWEAVPGFGTLTPLKTGTTTTFELTPQQRDYGFSFQFTGYITVPADGQYTFSTNSDDGSLLYIGSTLVVNNDGSHDSQERNGTIGLKAGTHAFMVAYLQGYGSQNLQVSYAGPSFSKTSIPATALRRVASTTPLSNLRTPENPTGTVAGLDYKYYEGSWNTLPNFAALTPTKSGTVATPSLTVAERENAYALQYTGYITVPADGQYTFYTNSDDGSRLYIGSTLVVDNDGLHGDQELNGTVGLQAGTHAFTVTFFENDGGQTLQVSYAGPGVGKQIVPASAYKRAAGATPPSNLRTPENPTGTVAGLDYKYYEGYWNALPNFSALTPAKSGTIAIPGLVAAERENAYALQYTGYITVPADGQYTFYTNSDDGSRLYIGSTLVVDNDGLHGSRELNGTIGLQAGTHAFTVAFFENDGGQILEVSYAGPSVGKQIVPASAYKRAAGATPPSNLRTPENPANTVAGLDYKYYEGFWDVLPSFTSLAPLKSNSTALMDLGARQRDYGYAFQYTGYVSVPTDGQYTFFTSSDDGSQLYIGSTLVVDNNGSHDTREASGAIGLQAGTHAFTVTYFQNGGGQNLAVHYQGPSLVKQAIPASALRRVVNGAARASAAVALPASISERKTHSMLEVYPNPLTERGTIHFRAQKDGPAQVYLYNELGALISTIYQENVVSGQEYYLPLSTEHLSTGVYLCRLISNGRAENMRITIVR